MVVGGRPGSRRINVPSGLERLPLREKDLTDLRFGAEHSVDYVAL